MKYFALILALIAAPVAAQTDTSYRDSDRMAGVIGTSPQGQAIIPKIACTDTSNNRVSCGGGGGSGGGGDASAANQSTQITRETEIRDRIGALTTPASGSTNQLLTALGTSQAATTAALPTRDTNGDLRVPTVTVTAFYVSIAANTSTELLAASATRVGYDVQCAGTAAVGLSRTHATLSSATPSAGGVDLVIPAGTTPFFQPAYVSGAGVTAYTGTAQACWGNSYARQ